MSSKKQQGSPDVKKIKKWVPIMASKEFGNTPIGETYVETPEKSVGVVMELNLMILTNDSKKQSNNVKFKITEYKNNMLNTEFVGCYLQKAQLKRVTRPGKLKVEDSNVYTTKDNVKIRVKPIFITKAKTNQSKLSAMRKISREVVSDMAKEMGYSEAVKELISGGLQRELKHRVGKVYPLASCIIKAFERLN